MDHVTVYGASELAEETPNSTNGMNGREAWVVPLTL